MDPLDACRHVRATLRFQAFVLGLGDRGQSGCLLLRSNYRILGSPPAETGPLRSSEAG